jgi:hypothetical protein
MRVDRQIHHPASIKVQFPTMVRLAWSRTNHSKDGVLSKKCQVQAHIALPREGSIAQAKDRQAKF